MYKTPAIHIEDEDHQRAAAAASKHR